MEDERATRLTLAAHLEQCGYAVEQFANPYPAIEWMRANRCSVVLTDFRLPNMDGIQFMREAKKENPGVEFIVMTAFGTVQSAVQALKEGAFDYLIKPFEFAELEIRIKKALELGSLKSRMENERKMLGAGREFYGLVARSPQMLRLFELAQSIAQTESNILIRGETGTGKGVLAEAIHFMSNRKRGPFVKVGCAQLTKELLESELFGHEPGAFTGALKLKHGRFELANGGTLFLDDVDDIPLDVQVKLLHAIEDRQFVRVGGEARIGFDARLICATKRNLKALVDEGKFRDDLFYRLKVIDLDIPPLRERREDILPLAIRFLNVFSTSAQKPVMELSPEAAGLMETYSWPGNVRELQHIIERAVALCNEKIISTEHLPSELKTSGNIQPIFRLNLGSAEFIEMESLTGQIERDIINWALSQSKGNQSKAADMLGIPRTTLRDKMIRLSMATEPAEK